MPLPWKQNACSTYLGGPHKLSSSSSVIHYIRTKLAVNFLQSIRTFWGSEVALSLVVVEDPWSVSYAAAPFISSIKLFGHCEGKPPEKSPILGRRDDDNDCSRQAAKRVPLSLPSFFGRNREKTVAACSSSSSSSSSRCLLEEERREEY